MNDFAFRMRYFELGIWNMECGTQDLEYVIWNDEYGHWNVEHVMSD